MEKNKYTLYFLIQKDINTYSMSTEFEEGIRSDSVL